MAAQASWVSWLHLCSWCIYALASFPGWHGNEASVVDHTPHIFLHTCTQHILQLVPTSLVTSKTQVSPSPRERSLHVASPSLFTSSYVCSLLTFYMVSFPNHPVSFLNLWSHSQTTQFHFQTSGLVLRLGFFHIVFSLSLVTFSSFTCSRELLLNNYNYLQVSSGCLSLKLHIDFFPPPPFPLPLGHQCCTSPHHSGSVCSHTVRCSLQPHWSLTGSPSPCKGPAVQWVKTHTTI